MKVSLQDIHDITDIFDRIDTLKEMNRNNNIQLKQRREDVVLKKEQNKIFIEEGEFCQEVFLAEVMVEHSMKEREILINDIYMSLNEGAGFWSP